jgi:hypothetical protein|nr:MAG TPA: hypothetical protein [Caudoviricetes sp.]
MTLEELKKKVVTITVHKNIVLGEDLHEDDLLEFLELQEEEACSDERLLQAIKNTYYGTPSDIEDIIYDNLNVTIHD